MTAERQPTPIRKPMDDNSGPKAGFTQLNNSVMFDPRLSPQARLLYGMIKSYAWNDKDNAFPGLQTLAGGMGCTTRMIDTYLEELEDSGLVTIKRRGNRLTNTYTLNDRIKDDWRPAQRKKAGRKASAESDMKSISGHIPTPPESHSDMKSISDRDMKCISDHPQSDMKSISTEEDKVFKTKNTKREEYKNTPKGVAQKRPAPVDEIIILHPVPKAAKKQSTPKEQSPPDPTLEHPAIKAWRDMAITAGFKAWPNPIQRRLICDTVTGDDEGSMRRWQKVLNHWAEHDYQFRNVPDMLNVFKNGTGQNRKERRT